MKIKVVKRHGDTFREKLYLPAIFGGFKITLRHFFGNLMSKKELKSKSYPEEQPSDITPRYRGVHRLTHRKDGSIRCVACFMCATACPAECIFIEARERSDGIDEKEPKIFNIDLLECVYCGSCVEACPCDAIRMDSGIFSFIGEKREDFVRTKETLLATKRADIC
ncbi:MAG: NADH-quinone oxidoreductase subunit I [Proteobacteria bacterium]|nr:MAG: NADH-quinone oxidoreductase subunit I [Pseudomonadota bacterium]